MLKIQCPKCKKSFFWTDDMPVEDKCPNPDCQWSYDVRKEVGRNIDIRENRQETQTRRLTMCPSCQNEIRSRLTVCSHCGRVVIGSKSYRKGSVFLTVCFFLIFLSLIIKYG